MDGLAATLLLFGAIAVAIVVPFVVVPEILERRGYNPRSGFVRASAWVTFLAIVLVPAPSSGFVLWVRHPAAWVLFLVALLVAILYVCCRLPPDRLRRLSAR